MDEHTGRTGKHRERRDRRDKASGQRSMAPKASSNRSVKDSVRNAADWGRDGGVVLVLAGFTDSDKKSAVGSLASELDLTVDHIDLSQVVSKYIGETEKNLASVFSEASEKGWILFFDEADALFGKRTTIKDTHDRYANMEVSYLADLSKKHEVTAIVALNDTDVADVVKSRNLLIVDSAD